MPNSHFNGFVQAIYFTCCADESAARAEEFYFIPPPWCARLQRNSALLYYAKRARLYLQRLKVSFVAMCAQTFLLLDSLHSKTFCSNSRHDIYFASNLRTQGIETRILSLSTLIENALHNSLSCCQWCLRANEKLFISIPQGKTPLFSARCELHCDF